MLLCAMFRWTRDVLYFRYVPSPRTALGWRIEPRALYLQHRQASTNWDEIANKRVHHGKFNTHDKSNTRSLAFARKAPRMPSAPRP